MNAPEALSYRQYATDTLRRLHADLLKIRKLDEIQQSQIAKCRQEMKHRGMKIQKKQPTS